MKIRSSLFIIGFVRLKQSNRKCDADYMFGVPEIWKYIAKTESVFRIETKVGVGIWSGSRSRCFCQ
jgi:hypothetical protein